MTHRTIWGRLSGGRMSYNRRNATATDRRTPCRKRLATPLVQQRRNCPRSRSRQCHDDVTNCRVCTLHRAEISITDSRHGSVFHRSVHLSYSLCFRLQNLDEWVAFTAQCFHKIQTITPSL